MWQSATPSIDKPKSSKCLRKYIHDVLPSAGICSHVYNATTSSHNLSTASSASDRPYSPPLPPDSLIRKQHPQTPLISHKSPWKIVVLSYVGCPLASCLAARLRSRPPSFIRNKHSLKSSGRSNISNIHNSIIAAFLRGHTYQTKQYRLPYCGLICGGSPGSPFSPPCGFAHNNLLTDILVNNDGRSPLLSLSLLRTRPCPQKQCCDLACGGVSASIPLFLPAVLLAMKPPQPPALIFLRRRQPQRPSCGFV